ncbi:MAG: hypothetical protein ACC653_01680 [Gammaproteobacteria bacterium]
MKYEVVSLKPTLAHIKFPGLFNHQNIIWDAKIRTLKSLAPANSNTGIKQFIDVPEHDSELKLISIALNVDKISTPEILKTIIMITNYKNLKTGRHEYGEVFYFK